MECLGTCISQDKTIRLMPKSLRGNIGVQHRRQPVALGLAQRIRRRGLPAAAQSEKKRDRAYRKQEGRRAPE